MTKLVSRRAVLSGLAATAGAAVIGWNTETRVWASGGAGADLIKKIPNLDGTLTLATEGFTEDFGRIVHRKPLAVLRPRSVTDVQKIVRYCARYQIAVAVNGQSGSGTERESHSHYGQALVDGGVAIDLTTLSDIRRLERGRADIGAGAVWSTLALRALETGQMPPVYNDYAHLSIGGTLSVGGLGGASQHFGAQADNIDWLQVVTGTGELITCSRTRHRELFEAVLVGAGQFGIIVRVGARLVPAAQSVRSFEFSYTDREAFLRDSLAIMRSGVVNDQNGYAVPQPSGGWTYRLAVGVFYTGAAQPDVATVRQVLSAQALLESTADLSMREWLLRFEPNWAALKEAGFWTTKKPWLMMFVSTENSRAYLDTVLGELTVNQMGAGQVRISPMTSRTLSTPNLVLPARRTDEFFEISLIRVPAPDFTDTESLLEQNRRFYDRAVGLGGKRYLVGAVPSTTRSDWRAHFGDRWPDLTRMKRRYDPASILTPGQRIFR